jgi:ElaB/YqjD/DUF883 family membrane-anchored ribosome-binding protein
MDPAASPQGSSGKPKKKRQSKKAKLSIKVASVPEDENRQSPEPLGQKVKNKKKAFEAVRSYVSQKPARGLLLALAIGIVAGSICRD